MEIKCLIFFLPDASHPLWAHGAAGAHGLWGEWTFDPWVTLGILLITFLYVRGWRALARRTGKPGAPLKRRAGWFAAGILTLVVALMSPVDRMADELLSLHMVQHNLLLLVAPPLLVLGYPLPEMMLALPAGLRRSIGRGWRNSGGLRRAWHGLSSPLAAWLLQALFLWAWHVPGLYQAAVENDGIHAIEHLCFLASSMLFWWVMLGTYGNRQKQLGLGIVYLFTAALQGGLLGALLAFSPRVLYPLYSARSASLGLSALADQQLAGMIMWVPSGLVYLLGALWMMKAWLDSMENAPGSAEEPGVAGKARR